MGQLPYGASVEMGSCHMGGGGGGRGMRAVQLAWWLHGGYTWWLHGGYMVVTWWLHGGYMVVTWWLHHAAVAATRRRRGGDAAAAAFERAARRTYRSMPARACPAASTGSSMLFSTSEPSGKAHHADTSAATPVRHSITCCCGPPGQVQLCSSAQCSPPAAAAAGHFGSAQRGQVHWSLRIEQQGSAQARRSTSTRGCQGAQGGVGGRSRVGPARHARLGARSDLCRASSSPLDGRRPACGRAGSEHRFLKKGPPGGAASGARLEHPSNDAALPRAAGSRRTCGSPQRLDRWSAWMSVSTRCARRQTRASQI